MWFEISKNVKNQFTFVALEGTSFGSICGVVMWSKIIIFEVHRLNKILIKYISQWQL